MSRVRVVTYDYVCNACGGTLDVTIGDVTHRGPIRTVHHADASMRHAGWKVNVDGSKVICPDCLTSVKAAR